MSNDDATMTPLYCKQMQMQTELVLIGAGPVGLLAAYLAVRLGIKVLIFDKSYGPLQAGRADALNARTLQIFDLLELSQDLLKIGLKCDTSAVWKDGKFLEHRSEWWTRLIGANHKCFLMIGQAHVEQLLDRKLAEMGCPVLRNHTFVEIDVSEDLQSCEFIDSNGESVIVESQYVIGADGSKSMVRQSMNIPFPTTTPEITWAVLDGVLETDFPKCPEIIIFQQESADVAWIPRELPLDRFYVRMDSADFLEEEALQKIRTAMHPYTFQLMPMSWSSRFTVREGVTESFSAANDKVFLAGDACHVHSVNGGQGLNTGLNDSFNLVWKLFYSLRNSSSNLLATYETERRPVAEGVIETSGSLVRLTRDALSSHDSHATDYVKHISQRSSFVTGMGISYSTDASRHNVPGYDGGLINICGYRFFDFKVQVRGECSWIYQTLDFTGHFQLISFIPTNCEDDSASLVGHSDILNKFEIYQFDALNERRDARYCEKQVFDMFGVDVYVLHVLVRPDMIVAAVSRNQSELTTALEALLK